MPIGGRRFTRTYSISSSPERRDGCITVTVKALDGGRMSGHLVRQILVGSYLPVGLPQGDFLVPEAVPGPPAVHHRGQRRHAGHEHVAHAGPSSANMPDVVHIHYAPHSYDVIFGTSWRPSPRVRIATDSRRCTRATATTRRTSPATSDAAQLDELCPDWRERDVWACGPQSLLDAVEAHFNAAGRGRFLHIERFRAPAVSIGDDAEGGTVTFLSDPQDVTTAADAATPLLRVAEDAGLNPDHGCRMGICHTCDVPLVAGTVRDLRTGELIDEPGHPVQICISGAAGDCEIQL